MKSILKLVYVTLVFIVLMLSAFSCKPKTDPRNVSTNTTYRSQSEQSRENQYNVYMSFFNYPYSSFYSVYKRMPTESEYFKMLDTLPWLVPNGKETIKWEPDATFPSRGVVTVLKRDFTGARNFTIDLNPNSASTDTTCDGSSDTFENRYHVSQVEHIKYLQFRFIKELIGCGVSLYSWQHNGQAPSSLADVVTLLGLEQNPDVSFDSLGISFDFNAPTPTITLKSDVLPEELAKTYKLVTTRVLKNSKKEDIPAIVWP